MKGAPLIDLAEATRDIRQIVAARDGDPLIEQQLRIARDLAEHLSRREGRDRAATGAALIEAACSLGGLAHSIGVVNEPGVVVLLNVLGWAGVELTGDQS